MNKQDIKVGMRVRVVRICDKFAKFHGSQWDIGEIGVVTHARDDMGVVRIMFDPGRRRRTMWYPSELEPAEDTQ